MFKTRCRLQAECVVLAVIGIAASYSVISGNDVKLQVVSTRPETASGGDVLVQLAAPANPAWSARLNGRDVTSLFRPAPGSGNLLALLSGLRLGRNTLEITATGAMAENIDITNHPLTGPIFSGAHQEPFICQTGLNGLGKPLDADCSAKTIVKYYYKSTEPIEVDSYAPPLPPGSLAQGFKIYDPAAAPPADLAQTVTSEGHTVPYIVRREIGTINRAVYDIQFLHQPGHPLPTPWTRPTVGWNGRLVYLVDGGCGAGYRQGTLNGAIGAGNEPFLSLGYATATSTLNVTGNNCNDRISAETLSMVKEYFIKHYGVPVHTIGWGDSGGAVNQQLIAQNYPGLLDGLIPSFAFPDQPSTAQSVTDCALLDRVFSNSGRHWTEEQKTAVSGFATWRTCSNGWSDGKGHPWAILDPSKLCPPLLPKEMIYERNTNPRGVRCDIYDNEVNVLGRNPRTGLAYRPLDNVGVQYGLVAFNGGQIDAEQFVELNERIGGYDEDGRIVTARTEADPEAIRHAYERGLVLTGDGGLSQVPIIEWRVYDDDQANQHDRFRSFVTRARLIAANGDAENQVLLVFPRYTVPDLARLFTEKRFEVVFPERARTLVRQMDRWLDNIAADSVPGTLSEKMARDKPADLADGCWTTGGEHIVEHASYDDPSRCNQMYPSYGDPRIAAGGPLTDDVLKCALKPISAADYSKPLTLGQLTRLKASFPTGVCDYTRQGVGQDVIRTVWQRY